MLVVGATAGHVYPALSVADELRRHPSPPRVLFVAGGAEDGAGTRRLLANEELEFVPASPIKRAGAGGLLRAARQTSRGFVKARRLLTLERAALVIGFGSYVSGGALLAARTLGIPTAIHEANAYPGLANRWLKHVVDRVYLGFAEATRFFPGASILVTGTPVRAAIAALASSERDGGSARARVLVMSGSRGDDFLSREVPHVVAALARRGVGVEVRQTTPFVADMAPVYAQTDLAIVRGGAGTLAELAVVGIPAVIVPLGDAADDHQTANAREVAGGGAALSVAESSWSADTVSDWIASLLRDPQRWRAASAAARTLARPDAAARLAADAMTLIDRGR